MSALSLSSNASPAESHSSETGSSPRLLIVDDIETARADLMRHGAAVGEVFHFDAGFIHTWGTQGREPGPDARAGLNSGSA